MLVFDFLREVRYADFFGFRRVLSTTKPKEVIMILSDASEVSRALVTAWKQLIHGTEEARREASLTRQRKLIRELIEPEVMTHPKELVLFFHESLVMRQTGEHSFAYGSTMGSRTVYWVSVGRMTGEKIVETEGSSVRWGPPEGQQVNISFPPQFLLPVEWQMQLWPIYPDSSHHPCYTVTHPGKHRRASDVVPRDAPIDLSAFGQHLFRVRREGPHDWATHFAVAIGNASVKQWLEEQCSAKAYKELMEGVVA